MCPTGESADRARHAQLEGRLQGLVLADEGDGLRRQELDAVLEVPDVDLQIVAHDGRGRRGGPQRMQPIALPRPLDHQGRDAARDLAQFQHVRRRRLPGHKRHADHELAQRHRR